MLSTCAFPAVAQDAPAPAPAAADDDNPIVVTGFRASLQSSTEAKRASTGFTDSIFAEDIGKFPDTNIAESLNRIPGITISREITGEGLQVAIRGLGTNFTRVLLNNAPIAVASTGRDGSQSTNREVDLDIFPTELFTQLTVNKSSTASMLEGGAAGTVNLRSARPFDNEGTHIT
jgi:TonB-dependent receptor